MSFWVGLALLAIGGFLNLAIEDTNEDEPSILETVSRILGVVGIVVVVFSWLGVI